MSLSPKQFSSLANKLNTKGGFSANTVTGGAPRVGYMVAKEGNETQLPTSQRPATAADIQGHAAGVTPSRDTFIGGWKSKSGDSSLDASQQFKGKRSVASKYGGAVADADARTSALDMVVARNQEAGYDLKKDDDLTEPGWKPDLSRRQGDS